MNRALRAAAAPVAAVAAVAAHDLLQRKHALLRNFPVLQPGWDFPAAADCAEIRQLMAGTAPQGSSAPPAANARGR